jgi:signal transduction histidine kinase
VFKIKVIMTIGFFFLLFGAVVVIHSMKLLNQTKMETAESQARAVVGGTQQVLQSEFSRIKLLPQASAERLSSERDILALVVAQLPSGDRSDTKLSIERSEVFQGNYKSADLNQILEKQVSKRISSASQMFVSLIAPPSRTKHGSGEFDSSAALVFAWRDDQKLNMVLAQKRLFQKVIETFKSSRFEVVIASSLGEVLAHPEEAYFGAPLVRNAMTDQAMKTSAFGSGVYDIDKNAKVFGFFEKVPQTQLTLMASVPMDLLADAPATLPFQFGLIFVGFLMMALGLVHFFFKQQDDLEHHLQFENVRLERELADHIHREKLKSLPALDSITPPPLVTESERQELSMKALKKMVASLAHEINPPLVQVLAVANLLREEKNPQKLVTFSDQLVSEIRRVKSTLEKIFSWSGEKAEPRSQSLVSIPLVQAINHFQSVFQKNRIELIQDYKTTFKVLLSPSKLQRAFEEIIQNSVDALERVENKRLDISVLDDHAEVVVRIVDNGEGIDPRYSDRIFEPFFTTRSHRKKQGLGLSAVMGILKEQGAKLKVDSERGKYTAVEIRFDQVAPAEISWETSKPLLSETASSASATSLALTSTPILGADLQFQENDFGFAKVALKAPISDQEFQDSATNEVDLETLLEVPPAQGIPHSAELRLEGLHVDKPRFKFEKRPSLLDDHVVEVPQSFSVPENSNEKV